MLAWRCGNGEPDPGAAAVLVDEDDAVILHCQLVLAHSATGQLRTLPIHCCHVRFQGYSKHSAE